MGGIGRVGTGELARGMDGVPVAAPVSTLTAVAWFLSVGGVLLLAECVPPCPANGLLRMVLPFASCPSHGD
ncbi:hypothetical protein GCM10010103_55550 [Streptomyces paradoxus]